MRNYRIKIKGFTLIELLVVMAIIALLSGLSLFALQGARSEGRNARRKSDLETIRSAFELYKADCNTYPGSLGSKIEGSCTVGTNTYLEEVPKDPSTGTAYVYSPSAGNTKYTLKAVLEDCSASCDWIVTNP